MPNPQLPIHDLDDRHIGLTPATAAYWTEGARVCLDRHHEPPIEFEIREVMPRTAVDVDWMPTDDRTRLAWNNEIDTTEAGAYACVLAAVELYWGMTAVARSEHQTGSDYYVAPPGGSSEDPENRIRLEVSGADRGTAADVAYRLRSKLAQAERGDSALPAIAGVVGFRARLILLARLEES